MIATVFKKNNSAATTQIVTLPEIAELRDPNFLDVLLPPVTVEDKARSDGKAAQGRNGRTHPFMDALLEAGTRTKTANGADALNTTSSALLDAFQGLNDDCERDFLDIRLKEAWKADPAVALKIIWNVRSIPDGKGSRQRFYRCWGWLYRNHPRTALVNLAQLVEPVSEQPGRRRRRKNTTKETDEDEDQGHVEEEKEAVTRPRFKSHGYWKDLLNILVLALQDDLDADTWEPTFLNGVRLPWTLDKDDPERARLGSNVSVHACAFNATVKRAKKAGLTRQALQAKERYGALEKKLATPKFRALYITVARLFADRLLKDVKLMTEANKMPDCEEKFDLLFQISLAGKWAPSPGAAHDRLTNISTAIAFLVGDGLPQTDLPAKVTQDGIDATTKAHIMRSFYQRWLLKELRQTLQIPEPLMSANRWQDVRYRRVASKAMQMNSGLFFQHDTERFREYVGAVESGKSTMSGATLMPHELLNELIRPGKANVKRVKLALLGPAANGLVQELQDMRVRVIEAQWNALVDNLRESGSLGDALAICDVSGSMGKPGEEYVGVEVAPIMPAIALSLIIASLAAEPFNGGFITFSKRPSFVKLDLENDRLKTSLWKTYHSDAGFNTDFRAVFMDLLLPMAKERGLRKEDMVKRLFVFTDMQFDAANGGSWGPGWETTYDAISRAYAEAGYDVPQIVFWDLANSGTFEVNAEREGVAMMSGFSAAMVKVFMGEEPEEQEEKEEGWEKVEEENGAEASKKEQEDFNPLKIMEKALKRFDTLQVVD
ncbi:hypothetical protein A4X13_0g2524 [Tilletia indica]|uniref:TROVE domain-containing protein n=1 Tax=Tilletia indica TaxID=43049 RepID=A0A177TST1_9BASI|nr:hypothetical protein A4X13_0g2524 [Tilletia indica]